MEPRRIIVGTSLANIGPASRPPLVGIFRYVDDREEFCAVVVKAVVKWSAPDTLATPHALIAKMAQADALVRPVDLVPMKFFVDVLVTGTVDLSEAGTCVGSLTVGKRATDIVFAADTPKVPLVPPYAKVASMDDEEASMAPLNAYDCTEVSFNHPLGFPWDVYQSANSRLAQKNLETGAAMRLEVPQRGRATVLGETILPSVNARVMIDPSAAGRDLFTVDMKLDTIVFAFDKKETELTWRGTFPTFSGVLDVDRILVGFAPDDALDASAPRDDKEGGAASSSAWRSILRELPHGHFTYAWFFDDAVEGKAPPELDEHQVRVARLQTWAYPLAPEPRLSVEKYATITAELAENREPREATLSRHGLDEYGFALEERAWAERIASESKVTGGQPPVASQLADALLSASERQARPEDPQRTLRAYAEVLVKMKDGEPAKVLKEANLSLGEWLRWDRNVTKTVTQDPQVARQLHAILAELSPA